MLLYPWPITNDCSTKGKPLHIKGQIDNLWNVKHVVTPYTAKSFLIVVYFLIVQYQGNALGCRVVVSESYNISGGGKSYESGGCRCMEHTKSSQRDRKITPQPGNEPPRSFDRTGGKRNFRWRSFFVALAASLYETTFENMSRQYLKENFLPVCGKHWRDRRMHLFDVWPSSPDQKSIWHIYFIGSIYWNKLLRWYNST